MTILNTVLGNSAAANIFVSSGTSAITTIHLCNTTGATITANLYLVTAGNIAGANNAIYTNLSITAQNTYIIYAEKFILSNDDTIRANASAGSAITATVSSIGI